MIPTASTVTVNVITAVLIVPAKIVLAVPTFPFAIESHHVRRGFRARARFGVLWWRSEEHFYVRGVSLFLEAFHCSFRGVSMFC